MIVKEIINEDVVVDFKTRSVVAKGSNVTFHIYNNSDADITFLLDMAYKADGDYTPVYDPDDNTIIIGLEVVAGGKGNLPITGATPNTVFRLSADGTGATGNITITVTGG